MEETKRRRFIIRAVLEGEVDVQEAPPVPEYPKTLTGDDPGVALGSFDISKNTNVPPYIANSSPARAHCIGDNAMGYPVELGKTYTISVGPDAEAYAVAVRTFNEDAVAQIENVQAISAVNNRDTGWITMTDGSASFTTQIINGKEPLCMWMVFKKNSTGSATWSSIEDLTPITITES